MARVPIRYLPLFRSSFLSQPTSSIPARPNLYTTLFPFSYSFSDFPADLFYETLIHSPYHQALNLLKACQHMTHLFQIQAYLITSGLLQKPHLSDRILKLSSNFFDTDYTVSIFRCIESPDTFTVNTMIKAYACSSAPEDAVIFFFEMLKNDFFPNSFTFPPLLSSCAKAGCSKSGQKCHGQAVKNGVDGVLPVQNCLINLYACCGLTDVARQIVDEMDVRDLVTWNSIIDGLAKFGSLSEARQLFDAMPERNVISWNIMITGYLNGKNPGHCMKLFRNMMNMGFSGNNITMVTVLTACGRSARLNEGRSVHGSLVRTFVNLSLTIDVALVDMYSKCGRPEIARLVFDMVSVRNLVCWNAMILGHCIHGNPQDGLNLYAEMVRKIRSKDDKIISDKSIRPGGQVVTPDEITFIGVLCACARDGRLTEGRNYFNEMINSFSIKPNFAHCWCMANLLARVGLVQEAVEFITIMPVEGDKLSGASQCAELLGLCRFQGDSRGEQIAKALIESDPQNPLYHAFLLNIYAVAGKWDDVARIKGIMNEKRMGIMLGCNLADLKTIVHSIKLTNEWQHSKHKVSSTVGELNM